MIAAEMNAKALSKYIGHSLVTITLDRYGHLLRGNGAAKQPQDRRPVGARRLRNELVAAAPALARKPNGSVIHHSARGSAVAIRRRA